MDATRIRSLLPLHEMIPLDDPKDWICGIAALEGHDFPVVDLRLRFGLAAGAIGRQPCVVVVQASGSRFIGFVADRVSEVITLRDLHLANGSIRVAGRLRRLLDPDAILGEEQFENFARLAATL